MQVGSMEDDDTNDDGMEVDGMEGDGMEVDGMEGDGMNDDGMNDDGIEGDGMNGLSFRNDQVHVAGDIVGEHGCPVCSRTVPEVYRAGRGRVYCTNACRQRAYRWRRAHGVRTFVQRDGAAERLVNDRRHAVRDQRDPVADVRDRRQREVTVCGLFARPVRDVRVTHDRFVPEHPWSCVSCSALISAGPPGSGIPDVVRRFAGGFETWTRVPRSGRGR